MEGFRIDIFDTKGAEYIFVIGYLLILIIFWRISRKQIKIVRRIERTLGTLSASLLRIPQGLFYNKNHTWAHLEESGAAKVGLDDMVQHITGEVTFGALKNTGEMIRKGDLMTEIMHEGKLLRIFSPISGQILNTNFQLAESPEIINEDPYEKGWIYKIKPSNWVGETTSYYLAERATEWSVKELERFKEFLAMSAKKYSSEPSMVILQDGGELRDNTLAQMPDELWQDFQKVFLDQSH